MRPPEEIPILPAEGTTLPEPIPIRPKPTIPPQSAESQRQTLSYLRGLLQSHGLEPKSKLGQNFLIDLNILDLVTRAAELSKEDCILEVGTGTGSLTAKMANMAGAVCSVEIDRDFHNLAKRHVGHRDNVQLLFGDCLARKNELNPDMLSAWQSLAQSRNCSHHKLIANLPYAIAAPLISNLLLTDIPIERMVVMVQWEIGERLRADVGTKDYNALSILVQSVADVEILRKIAPTNFFPRPKVDSAVVLIKPNAEKRAMVGDVKRFRAFLRDLYVHRRKNLRGALHGSPSGRMEKTYVDAKLRELDIDPTIRAEALSIAEHLRLMEAFA